LLVIYLFNTFGAYKIQGKSYDKIIANSTAITAHKNVTKVTYLLIRNLQSYHDGSGQL